MSPGNPRKPLGPPRVPTSFSFFTPRVPAKPRSRIPSLEYGPVIVFGFDDKDGPTFRREILFGVRYRPGVSGHRYSRSKVVRDTLLVVSKEGREGGG